jgi:hypothetical protein
MNKYGTIVVWYWENRSTLTGTWSSATFSTTISKRTGLGSIPILHGKRLRWRWKPKSIQLCHKSVCCVCKILTNIKLDWHFLTFLNSIFMHYEDVFIQSVIQYAYRPMHGRTYEFKKGAPQYRECTRHTPHTTHLTPSLYRIPCVR